MILAYDLTKESHSNLRKNAYKYKYGYNEKNMEFCNEFRLQSN